MKTRIFAAFLAVVLMINATFVSNAMEDSGDIEKIAAKIGVTDTEVLIAGTVSGNDAVVEAMEAENLPVADRCARDVEYESTSVYDSVLPQGVIAPDVVEAEDELVYEEAYGAPAESFTMFGAMEEEPSYYFKVYNQLTEPSQKVYEALEEQYEVFWDAKGTITINFDADEIPYAGVEDKPLITYCFASALAAFDYDHPETFWLNKNAIVAGFSYNKVKFYVTQIVLKLKTDSYTDFLCPVYNGDVTAAKEEIDSVELKAESLKGEAEQETSLYDRLAVINGHLIDENYYNRYVYRNKKNETSESLLKKAHNAASALTEQEWLQSEDDLGDPTSPVCEGYARAFKMVCDKMGIPCIVVSGNNHMWNYVYDTAGEKWYAVDSTWNDPVRAAEYNKRETPAEYRERYLLSGSETKVNGSTFISKHPANGAAWVGGSPFLVPTLSGSAYGKYMVTFDAGGGTCKLLGKEVTNGSGYGDLPVPDERAGYTFLGWFTGEDDGERIMSTDMVAITEDQTLYAHWQGNQYNVTFDANGGSCDTSDKEIVYGEAYGELPIPEERVGYAFCGWFTEAIDGTGIMSTDKVAVAGDHTLYAHWQARQYKVTLDANGGICSTAEKEVTYNEVYGELPVPEERTGYVFQGWYSDAVNGERVMSTHKVVFTEDHTLFAHWQACRYKIIFDADGGVCSTAEKEVTYGEVYGELPVPEERTGYVFLGWYSDKTGENKVMSTGEVLIADDHTLYARWQLCKYKVTFDATGGICQTVEKEVTYGEAYGELPVPEDRDGYEFLGWYTDTADGNKVMSTSWMDTAEDHTLYARWQKKPEENPPADEGNDKPQDSDSEEEKPGEEKPEEEKPGEEKPGEERPGEEKPGEEKPGEEKPGEERPGEEKPGEEKPGEEKPGEEKPGEEKPGEEKPGENLPGEEDNQDENDPIPVPEEADLGDVLLEDIPEGTMPGQPASERIPAKLWIAGVEDREYTGKAIIQAPRVYDGKKLLTYKTDYSITYQNNVNVGRAFLTVTCKGNYEGTGGTSFRINPKRMERVDVSRIYSVGEPNPGSTVNPVKTVVDGKKSLKGNGIDYTVTCFAKDGQEVSLTGIPAGAYRIVLEGCGNYTGVVEFDFTVAKKGVLPMSGAKVTLSSKKVGYGNPLPSVTGVKIGGKTYTAASDVCLSDLFRVEYPENCMEVGTHEIMIYSCSDDFGGAVGAFYTVEGLKLTKSLVSVAGTYTYAGEPVEAHFATELTEGTDYTVSYLDNDKAGKATAVLKGIGNYAGTLKLSYTIRKGNISAADAWVNGPVQYNPVGAKADLKVKLGDKLLTEGKDYTVKYKNNTSVGVATAKAVLSGKGSFSGTKTVAFSIEKTPLTESMITVSDKEYSKKKKVYKQPVTLKLGSKKLKAGKDYTLSYSSAARVTAEDMEKGYHEITVTVTAGANSNYTGEATKTFTVYAPERKASKLKVSVKDQIYTGKNVTLLPEDITIGSPAGILAEDVMIVSYKNNQKTGTKASVTIRVKGYGGTKTVAFKIVKKQIGE